MSDIRPLLNDNVPGPKIVLRAKNKTLTHRIVGESSGDHALAKVEFVPSEVELHGPIGQGEVYVDGERFVVRDPLRSDEIARWPCTSKSAVKRIGFESRRALEHDQATLTGQPLPGHVVGRTRDGEPVYGQAKSYDEIVQGALDELKAKYPKKPTGLAYVAVPCGREGCGYVTTQAVGEIDPKEYHCAHSFKIDRSRMRMGAFVCSNCQLAVPVETLLDAGYDLSSRYTREGNALADSAQRIKDEWREAMLENAQLRRKVERLERDARKRR